MKWNLLFCLLAALAAATAPDEFFRSLDRDSDGDVDRNELEQAILEANGKIDLKQSVALALAGDEDESLDHQDLVKHWIAMASLLSSERVGEWLEHAIDLPQSEAEKFVKNNFTGLDLPALLGKNCNSVLVRMNVTLNRQQRIKLMGAIKLRMLNAGQMPASPELKALPSPNRCGIILTWQQHGTAQMTFPEVHKYRLFRRIARDDDFAENTWMEIYSGASKSFSDRPKANGINSLFDYKLEAWNLMGKTEAMELHDVALPQCNTPTAVLVDSTSQFWMQWVWLLVAILGEFKTALVSVNAFVASLGFMYYYIKMLASDDDGDGGAVPARSGSNSISGLNCTEAALDKQIESIKRASSQTTAAAANGGTCSRPKINLNRCAQCNKPISRNSRHHCGQCMRVFCIAHTAVQPHMVVGNKVLTACGVNSKCRCFECADMVAPEYERSRASSSWRVVRDRIVMSKTIKVWKRSTPPETDEAE